MTILPIAYWPPVSYIALLYLYPKTKIEVCENYQKKSIRNKCQIITGNGPKTLSVPLLKGKHGSLPITEVKIAYHEAWQENHINTIKTAYSNAPYYQYYINSVEHLIRSSDTYLYELNSQILEWIRGTFVNEQVSTIEYTQTFQSVTNLNFSQTAHYSQVYQQRHGFIGENVSILDLIFNVGYEIPFYFDNWSNFVANKITL